MTDETLPTPTMAAYPKPSRFEQPANVEMFALAIPRMRGYQSDLAHDMVRIVGATKGQVYLWIVRDHGTHLFGPEENDRFQMHVEFFRRHMPSEQLMAYSIVINEEGGTARGFPYVTIFEVP